MSFTKGSPLSRIEVEVTMWVTGIHYWKDAPERIKFLREKHRHRFKIIARKEVTHLDRDIEFYLLSEQVYKALQETAQMNDMGFFLFNEMSCETIASKIVNECCLSSCSVSEDGENGATVYA